MRSISGWGRNKRGRYSCTMNMLFITALLVSFSSVLARQGFDLSVATSTETWNCLASAGDDVFGIIRAYRNVGVVDANAATSIKAASAAGVRDLGVYMFPCIEESPYTQDNNITCASASSQVIDTVQYLEREGVSILGSSIQPKNSKIEAVVNAVWLDIEDEVPSKYYASDPSINQAFLADIVAALEGLGIEVGIYSTSTYWKNILDNVEGYGCAHSLWYPRYDNTSSFEFFEPFADWELSSLKVKQIAPDVGLCGVSQIDQNYAETSSVDAA